jgi:hypothetical protein
MNVKFEYSTRERVKVIGIDTVGFIEAMLINHSGGLEYRVVYWLDGERHEEWMYGTEIELVRD